VNPSILANTSLPAVSVLIVNWNGAAFLPRCLEALAAQTFTDFEVLLVDNASQDHSADDLEFRWPFVKVIRLEQNLGFAAANNLGASQASGRWLVLLNNDAFPKEDWLAALTGAAAQHPDYSFFASCMLQVDDPGRMDACGDVLNFSGLAWHRDHYLPVEKKRTGVDEVFSPCAAAAMYDKAAFLKAGGFTERYFSHLEDIDLGFRMRLQGERCMFVPEAEVEHIGGASFGQDSEQTVYQVQRNMMWLYVTDTPGLLVWTHLPAHILANIVMLIYYSLSGRAKPVWQAKWDGLLGLPEAFRQRRLVQKTCRVDAREIDRLIDHGWLAPYLRGRRSGKLLKVVR
jgi:GT2 family glycosyltransferase